MSNVLICGPPAAGKLTVARELAEQTGFVLLHNHLATDLARNVLPFGAPGFWPLVDRVRTLMLATAAEQSVSVVTTFAFSSMDRPFVAALDEIVRRAGGTLATCGSARRSRCWRRGCRSRPGWQPAS